jgi:hypothetical protein
VAVERRGLPPYEAADRIYCLDGGQQRGVRVGDRLAVKRAGEVRALGHLRVTEVRGDRAETHFESAGSIYPMKGDLAIPDELKWMPAAGLLNADPLPVAPAPKATPEAPPREGILFFLPQQAELSPAGLKKLEAWVEAWGAEGRWAVQVPTAKAVKPALQKQRAESLQAALRALGIEHVKLESEPRSTEGKYDPTWIRHWD